MLYGSMRCVITPRTHTRAMPGLVGMIGLLTILLLGGVERTRAAVVLQYHHVSNATPEATSISPELFEQHLEYLEQHDYRVWPLTQLIEHLRRKNAIPDKVVSITFDDAYASIFSEALPRLKQRDWPFTVFVATAQIGEEEGALMSWGQLAQLQKDGATLANHGHNHDHLVRRLNGETPAQWRRRITEDIKTAEGLLEKKLGADHALFAYPYGEYTGELKSIVESLGYAGFGQQSGAIGLHSDLAALPRFPMTNYFGRMDTFETKVSALALPLLAVSPPQHLIEGPALLDKGLTLVFGIQHYHPENLACYISGQGKAEIDISRKESRIQVNVPGPIRLNPGRSRINCTAPSSAEGFRGRFYWSSHPWMYKEIGAPWYQEP